jgi:hypothetical protein
MLFNRLFEVFIGYRFILERTSIRFLKFCKGNWYVTELSGDNIIHSLKFTHFYQKPQMFSFLRFHRDSITNKQGKIYLRSSSIAGIRFFHINDVE